MRKVSLGFSAVVLAACTFASAFSSELPNPSPVPLASHKQVAANPACTGTRTSVCAQMNSKQCNSAYVITSNNGTGYQCEWRDPGKCANANPCLTQ